MFDRIMEHGNIAEQQTADIVRQCASALKCALFRRSLFRSLTFGRSVVVYRAGLPRESPGGQPRRHKVRPQPWHRSPGHEAREHLSSWPCVSLRLSVGSWHAVEMPRAAGACNAPSGHLRLDTLVGSHFRSHVTGHTGFSGRRGPLDTPFWAWPGFCTNDPANNHVKVTRRCVSVPRGRGACKDSTPASRGTL